MPITVTITTDSLGLTRVEQAILRTLLDLPDADEPTPKRLPDIEVDVQKLGKSILADEPEPPKQTAAAKARAAKKAAPEPEPEQPADEPEPVGETGETSLERAKRTAAELVGEGKSKKVRAALEATGTPRVSELQAKDADAFLEALGA